LEVLLGGVVYIQPVLLKVGRCWSFVELKFNMAVQPLVLASVGVIVPYFA
jgi:hypothetical protein